MDVLLMKTKLNFEAKANRSAYVSHTSKPTTNHKSAFYKLGRRKKNKARNKGMKCWRACKTTIAGPMISEHTQAKQTNRGCGALNRVA